MPSVLVIRLHPLEPVEANKFTDYLQNLTINAFDISYADTKTGTSLGQAEFGDPTDPGTRIVQHIEPSPGGFDFQSVATAVIEIPDSSAGGEYETVDIRLVLDRNGTELIHKQIYYNVNLKAGALPPADQINYQAYTPTSLFLALLPPGNQLDPTDLVPEDGTAPNYTTLRTAVEKVLTKEPGNTAEIINLSFQQCRHIANELIWDRTAFPLPEPKRGNKTLEDMYTGTHKPDSDEERDRRIFEGELLAYYTKHNTEADRLANFIYSLSAAIWCEEESKKAKRVGFHFPVIPTTPGREAKVILRGVGGAVFDPAFVIPAAYFYALTAILPPQVAKEQRYKMVQLDSEAQTITNLLAAKEDNIIKDPENTNPPPVGGTPVNIYQAARRLRALGLVGEAGTPECEVALGSEVHGLVLHWLARVEADINVFWGSLVAADVTGHLDLVLFSVTKHHDPLITAIKAPGFGVNNADDLKAKTNQDWEDLLNPKPPVIPDPTLLPEFTKPGTIAERTQAFIRNLRKFFDVANVFNAPAAPTASPAATLERPNNPVDMLFANYPGGFTFSAWDPGQLANTLGTIFPGDPDTQQKFTDWLFCIQELINLTAGITPEEIQFSVMEALWARGMTSRNIIANFSKSDFKDALVGSVAYDHADAIWNNAEVPETNPEPNPANFKPINPDGSLVNCIPPAHRSPLGPVAYLHDLLRVAEESTCEHPIPSEPEVTLAELISTRRGLLGDLLGSKANLEVPLPLIDLVNESLEHMVATGDNFGAIFNTTSDKVGGHELKSNPNPSADVFLHDPETLFEALPEHSTPAVPTKGQAAYDKLKIDFSTCTLPYHQSLDISRTYLKQLGTHRYTAMRRFRKDVTEFVLDPSKETAEFQKHLWRYPVRIETAIEYLCITPEEYSVLFQNNIPSNTANPVRRRGRAARGVEQITVPLFNMYGFESETLNDGEGPVWTDVVVKLDEFLERTCLSYCEFIELWKSEFVKFRPQRLRGDETKRVFPDCEPCCLDKYQIEFTDPEDPTEALKRLTVFIRLWRKLQCVTNAHYTFTELRDICEVLQLFIDSNINPDFVRQLAAFQMLRDDFNLSLTDGTPLMTNATGAERLHLLAFWVSGASKMGWAIDHLLNQIQQYAINVHGCCCREPEFIKLLSDNLDQLSALAGFNPGNPTDTWNSHPTHTLRFAEILAKIYASQFRVGELLFLFTTSAHLQGDDPFPLQTNNEAKDSPFGLPNDEDKNSLFTLRKKLLAVEVCPENAAQWTWRRMEDVQGKSLVLRL